ncbi:MULTISPECIES: hypothetical protein [Emticicia]|uniref:hypothetical protein n=1 Tax=Emticicia TaxID=312278 RepID=UPI00209D8536|nr:MULTISPECIES: hypothetical protein [Emticicia]UTA66478.1 hypothetical protein MB380_12800 [Emticicia sp. 21SJ11W-3]
MQLLLPAKARHLLLNYESATWEGHENCVYIIHLPEEWSHSGTNLYFKTCQILPIFVARVFIPGPL